MMPEEKVVDNSPAPLEAPPAPPAPPLTPAHGELESAMTGQHKVVSDLKEALVKEQEKLDGMIHQHNTLAKPIPEGGLKVNRADPSFKENRG